MSKSFLDNGEAARTLLESAVEGVVVAEVDTKRVRYANAAACTLFGHTKEEFLALTVLDIHPAENAPLVVETFERQARGEFSLARAIPCRRRDGTVFQADINTSKVTVDGLECNVGFFTDVTERVRAEAERDAARADWKVIFDAIPHPTVIMDAEHTVLAANQRFATLLGQDPATVQGMKCWEIFHSPTAAAPPAGCPFEKLLSSQTIETTDMEMEVFGGWYIVSCTPIYGPNGALEQVIHIAIDITERKRIEEALAQTAAEHRDLSATLETVFDSIPDILGVQDLQHGILRYNRAGYEYLQKTPDEVRGKRCFELIGNDKPCEPCATSEVYRTRQPARIERHFEELKRWIEIRAYPVLDGEGRLVRIIEHLRDITDLKQAEAARIRYAQQLQQAQRLESLGILAGGIAHDFNNLLGGMYGFVDIARLKSEAPRIRGYLDSALTTMDRARGLTQQLLTFAKGGMPQRETGRLNTFLRETTEFALSGANVSARFELPDDLWPSDYDPNQLGQVVENLVINAVQAMPAGGTITVAAANLSLKDGAHQLLPGGRYVRLSFQDTGVGIPENIQDRLFDPFFTTKQTGSGLGLATSHSIVRKHDGCIEVDSVPGTGSTFHILLPASAKPVGEAAPATEAAGSGSGTIVVMDDEETMRLTLIEALGHAGYAVKTAADGEAAVELVAAAGAAGEALTAAILDLTVPGGMGGREAAEAIRRLAPDLPLFVISGYAEDPVLHDPQAHGFTGSLRKPFRNEELYALLQRHTP